MIEQHPLIPLIFSVLFLLIILIESFAKKRFIKSKFFLAIFFLLLSSLALVFKKEIDDRNTLKDIVAWALLVLDISLCLAILSTINFDASSEVFQKELTKTINESKYYVLLDKKDRVKEMSSLFLKDLGCEFDDVYKKNLFDVIEIKYRIIGFNQEVCNKKDIQKYYNKFYKKVKPEDKDSISIMLQGPDKEEKALYLMQTVIFVNDKYKGRIFFGDCKTEESLVGMEKDLNLLTKENELLNERFVAILDKIEEGVFFFDLKNDSIWFNDVLVEKLNLEGNTLSKEEFEKLIHKDDIEIYRERLKQITDDFELKFKFDVGGYYSYVNMKGKKIDSENVLELCGTISLNNDYSYEKTNTDLDEIKGEPELQLSYRKLISTDRVFLVVAIRIDSIPLINEKCGRPVGNLFLSNYINLFKKYFVDDNNIYRIGGLDFIAIVTDYRKMDLLKNNLHNKDILYNVKADYGNNKLYTEVFLGLSYSNDTHNSAEALKNAKDSLKISQNPQFNNHFVYFKDLK